MELSLKYFEIAYKKLKSSLYFDRTQNIVRDELVRFETEQDIAASLKELYERFVDNEKRDILFEEIISSISYYSFPKSIDEDEEKEKKKRLIRNFAPEKTYITEEQYHINMDIRGHILGVLWLMFIGYNLDKNLYCNSYGNRIRKKLYSEFSNEPTFSPYLFEPYFQQYESWRERALDEAKQHMHSGQNVLVLTMDFKRFYYSVDITLEIRDAVLSVCEVDPQDEKLIQLNNFVFQVICEYSNKVPNRFDKRNILPIGFLPSNVLGNYVLDKFDKAVIEKWNPLYYGRYVDDILIVDKIENDSPLALDIKEDKYTADDIIQYYLENCSCKKPSDKCDKNNALFYQEYGSFRFNDKYKLHEKQKNDLWLNKEKIGVYYFSANDSDALIDCFREKITKQKSEFRYLPGDEEDLVKDNINNIYDLMNDATINKFSGIKRFEVDKFEFSKYLGKQLQICSLIDEKSKSFETNIEKILTPRVIVENYSAWEKIIEILVIKESWTELNTVVCKIVEAINNIQTKNKCNIKSTLLLYMRASLCKALALVWGEKVIEFVDAIAKNKDLCKIESEILGRNDLDQYISHLRKRYLETYMIDKSVISFWAEHDFKYISDEKGYFINLSKSNCKESKPSKKYDKSYKFYPYIVSLYEIMMDYYSSDCHLYNGISSDSFSEIYNEFLTINYDISMSKVKSSIKLMEFPDRNCGYNMSFWDTEGPKKDKVKVAIANTLLHEEYFTDFIYDRPNRSRKRFGEFVKLVNEAIHENVDILVLPEAFLPREWLFLLQKVSCENDMLIVSGIEHFKHNKTVYNLTAVIMPYHDPKRDAIQSLVHFHLKTHYAPHEKQLIEGYGMKAKEGNSYTLFKWKDCYFPVYCCYELTDIVARSLFQSMADFLAVVEWNKDINYYSNIIESLSRDIHCYCIQVNTSNYGDSRITKPSKTENKDIIRTKGGINSTVLVGEIDIKALRDFQVKDFNLQDKDDSFKITPPGFDKDIVMKKIKGESLL